MRNKEFKLQFGKVGICYFNSHLRSVEEFQQNKKETESLDFIYLKVTFC